MKEIQPHSDHYIRLSGLGYQSEDKTQFRQVVNDPVGTIPHAWRLTITTCRSANPVLVPVPVQSHRRCQPGAPTPTVLT
jgi:hypothetical protein